MTLDTSPDIAARHVELYRLMSPAAEYTVLRKLEWYRRGGEVSERQWSDVVAVLRAQGARLDRSAMDQWAQRLGIRDLLQRVRLEVE